MNLTIPTPMTAKKVTTNRAIKMAHNWLFFTILKKSNEVCASMVEIVFYGMRNGASLKEDPNGKKSLARYTSNPVFATNQYNQPLPPGLDLTNLTIQIKFFIDQEAYIQIDDFDFTKPYNGEQILLKSERQNDNLLYVNVSTLFSIAMSQAEQPAVSDSSKFILVEKGKSTYRVFDLDGGQFKILRDDTLANVNPTSPTGRGILKKYREDLEKA